MELALQIESFLWIPSRKAPVGDFVWIQTLCPEVSSLTDDPPVGNVDGNPIKYVAEKVYVMLVGVEYKEEILSVLLNAKKQLEESGELGVQNLKIVEFYISSIQDPSTRKEAPTGLLKVVNKNLGVSLNRDDVIFTCGITGYRRI